MELKKVLTNTIGRQALNFSLSQREIWFDQVAWPGSAHLNIGGCGFLHGRFDAFLFKAALSVLVQECDALRLVPHADGTQSLLASYEPKLQFVDVSSAPDPKEAMRQWWQRLMEEPFEIGSEPPWRFALLRGNSELHGLTIQFHHLIMDGWGTSRVMHRWSEIYNAMETGVGAVPNNSPPYVQFIEESNQYRQSDLFVRDAGYWLGQVPTLAPSLIVSRCGDTHGGRLPASHLAIKKIARNDYAGVESAAIGLGQSVFSYFLAALALYFARTSNCEDVVIGVPSLNRSGRKYLSTPGMFVGVLAVKLRVMKDMTVLDLLAAAGVAMRGALRHPRYPISELGRSLQLIRSGRHGLVDVLLSFERQDYAVAFGAALPSESRQLFSGVSRFPLGVTICEFHPEQDLEMVLDASSDCFEAGEAELMGQRLWHLVDYFVAQPNAPLSLAPLVPVGERWLQVHGLHQDIAFHDTTLPYIVQFEHHAALRPDAIALVWDSGGMSYAALNARSNVLANKLIARGVKRADIVALAIARSPEMVIALLAVSKAGAAFLPLDVEAPSDRLRLIVQDSGAAALLLGGHQAERYQGLHHNILTVSSAQTPVDSGDDTSSPPWTTASSDVAYVLFTSGSTGRPKGVVIEHATLAFRLAWLARAYEVSWQDRSAQATQVTFDPSLIELFLPLTHGASVALPPPGRMLPEAVAEFAARHGATIMAFVPSTLSRFAQAARTMTGLRLRVACCGGEVLSPEVARNFCEATGAVLYNVYGPTEAAIFVTAWKCDSLVTDLALPIGRPIDNSKIYVLDADQQPVPIGAIGEIYIGGNALAKGYLNRPDLDAQCFLPDPFESGKRVYRSGDRGWLGVDGNLHFVGRADRQVKLRGYRIELGEVEAACLSMDRVTQAGAKLITQAGKSMIHVWVATDQPLAAADVLSHVRKTLPDYMVPSGVCVTSELPVSSTGKIDYEQLIAPSAVLEKSVGRQPLSALETELLAIWQETLGRSDVSVTDNFFDVGGDSLAALNLVAALEKLLGKSIPMHLLIEHPSIAELARELDDDVVVSECMMRLSAAGRGVPLYLAVSGYGDVVRFKKLSQALGDHFEVYLLQPPTGMEMGSTLELAQLYAQSIAARALRPGVLAGFSVGGVAALETTRLLLDRHEAVRATVLIDTIFPRTFFGGKLVWKLFGWMVNSLNVQDLSLNGRRLGAMFSDHGLVSQVMALSDYRPKSINASVCLIKSSGFASWDWLFFRSWRKLFGSKLIEVRSPGVHGSIFENGNVQDLAVSLRSVLAKVDKSLEHKPS